MSSTYGRPMASRCLAFLSAVPIAVLVAACTTARPSAAPRSPSGSAEAPPSASASGPQASARPSTQPSAPAALPRNPARYDEGAAYAPAFDPATFVAGIQHPFFPMVPGASFIFDGDEHVEVEVLDETKDILGIQATVVRDRVFERCELVEDTNDWYAQDVAGNVWYLGEQTAEYDHGAVTTTAGSWETGVDGALPGIIMLADPRAGDTYRQEFLAGEAEDLGQVTAVSGSVSVPAGEWSGSDVLVTEEWTPLEPNVRERKIYARGLGVVRIRTIEGGDEVTTLTSATLPDGVAGTPGVACSRG